MGSCYSAAELSHEIIECLVTALEAKDAYTKGHSTRVADLACVLGELAGLKGEALEELHLAAHIHDIGKVGIPDDILKKAGPLSAEEYNILKEHSRIGYQILSRSKPLKKIADIVLCHHERWDGGGYPCGLRAEKIPFGSRIIAVCDAIDAMLSTRPYRKALNLLKCRQELIRNSGIQFDPNLIKIIEEYGLGILGLKESCFRSHDIFAKVSGNNF